MIHTQYDLVLFTWTDFPPSLYISTPTERKTCNFFSLSFSELHQLCDEVLHPYFDCTQMLGSACGIKHLIICFHSQVQVTLLRVTAVSKFTSHRRPFCMHFKRSQENIQTLYYSNSRPLLKVCPTHSYALVGLYHDTMQYTAERSYVIHIFGHFLCGRTSRSLSLHCFFKYALN